MYLSEIIIIIPNVQRNQFENMFDFNFQEENCPKQELSAFNINLYDAQRLIPVFYHIEKEYTYFISIPGIKIKNMGFKNMSKRLIHMEFWNDRTVCFTFIVHKWKKSQS